MENNKTIKKSKGQDKCLQGTQSQEVCLKSLTGGSASFLGLKFFIYLFFGFGKDSLTFWV